jgi:methanogenic corrinoid protein MtbC1
MKIAIKYTREEMLLEDITKICNKKGIKTVYQLAKALSDKYGKTSQNYEQIFSQRVNASEDRKNDLIEKIKNL